MMQSRELSKNYWKIAYYEVKKNNVSTNSFQFSWMTIQYLQVLVAHRRFCQLQKNSPVMASLYFLQTKINVPTEAKVLFLMFRSVAMVDSKQYRNWVCACLETIKTHYLERPLSKSRHMRFLRADQLYFNNDVFSCVLVHLFHLDDETLSKKGIGFITFMLGRIT